MADKRLDTYLVLLAPVLIRIDGVTENPADLEVAEAILVAAESADGIGLSRSEIAARAGLDAGDPRFIARFDMLARAGALQHLAVGALARLCPADGGRVHCRHHEELTRARAGSSTSRQTAQIERVCRAINRNDSPYGHLFDDANLELN